MSTEIPVDFTRLHFGQSVIATIFAEEEGIYFICCTAAESRRRLKRAGSLTDIQHDAAPLCDLTEFLKLVRHF